MEYKVRQCDTSEYNFERWLNAEARDGWRLHTLIRLSAFVYECFFERII